MKKIISYSQIQEGWKKFFLFPSILFFISYILFQRSGFKVVSDLYNRAVSDIKESRATIGSPATYTPGLFAVIGDYGQNGANESAVASLVKSWHPEYIITLGDNNYPNGASSTMDANVGQYYHSYIKPYYGFYGSGAPDINRFFPSLGNHDIMTNGGAPYFQYFNLPGNERYYDFIKGNIHFFVINSNPSEPNGAWSSSSQATWLKNKLAASSSTWKIIFFHHSPYVSDAVHGSQAWMQWPFKSWGADAVFSSHSHVYERITRNNLVYIVNGLGGQSKYSFKSTPVSGSQKRYNANFGALQVTVKPDMLLLKFYNVYYTLIDSYSIVKSPDQTPVCDAKITPGGSIVFCPGGSVTLYANTGSGFSYQWIKNGAAIPGAITSSYKASTAGDYQVKISFGTCTEWSAPVYVRVNTSLTAKITPGGPTSFCSGGYVALYANTCNGYSYQWKKNGVAIPGATGAVYYAGSSGSYQLKITQGSSNAWSAPLTVTVKSCKEAEIITMETDSAEIGLPDSIQTFAVKVYPNPTTGFFTLDYCTEEIQGESGEISVLNSSGQLVYKRPLFITNDCVKETVELDAAFPAGVYVLQIRSGNRVENIKLLLNR